MGNTRRGKEAPKRGRPATTPEGRENQIINQAYDLAERQIQDGTATSQVITHFLKLGSSREQTERERMRHETELLRVKVEAQNSQQRIEELYTEALGAMRQYQGQDEPEEEYDERY